jgi:hypothetical protein
MKTANSKQDKSKGGKKKKPKPEAIEINNKKTV